MLLIFVLTSIQNGHRHKSSAKFPTFHNNNIKLNVDLDSKLKSICKDTRKKRQPEHESMCSAPFLTIPEKLVAQGRPGP